MKGIVNRIVRGSRGIVRGIERTSQLLFSLAGLLHAPSPMYLDAIYALSPCYLSDTLCYLSAGRWRIVRPVR
jgi:hypothetical protein